MPTNRIAKHYSDVKLAAPAEVQRARPLQVSPDATITMTVQEYLNDCARCRDVAYRRGVLDGQSEAVDSPALRWVAIGGLIVFVSGLVWGVGIGFTGRVLN